MTVVRANALFCPRSGHHPEGSAADAARGRDRPSDWPIGQSGLTPVPKGGQSGQVTDDRVPGVAQSVTVVYRCSLCEGIKLNGNDGSPECPNESWHPMVKVDEVPEAPE